MRRLQEWAAPRFLNSALTKQSACADAHHNGKDNTPSPPTSAATESTPVTSTEEARLSPRASLQERPATPDEWQMNGVPAARRDSIEVSGSPPADDGQFVAYYSKVIDMFDKLHRVQHYPLDDDRIKNLRSIMEKNLDRLSRVQTNMGNSHQKKAEKALKFAQQRLRKFSDYRPPPSTSDSSMNSAAASSGASLSMAPPRYPQPTQAKRKSSLHHVPYGRETSDVHSWSTSVITPAVHVGENGVVPSVESTIANATKSQRRMMCAISSACSLSATPDMWSRPPLVVLPEDLVPVDTPVAQPAPTQPYVHAAPPSQQSFQMLYYAAPPHASQQMYQAAGRVPMQHAPPRPPQVHPQNSGGPPVNAYHQFSSYPRAV